MKNYRVWFRWKGQDWRETSVRARSQEDAERVAERRLQELYGPSRLTLVEAPDLVNA